jgi:hypothetical protein
MKALAMPLSEPIAKKLGQYVVGLRPFIVHNLLNYMPSTVSPWLVWAVLMTPAGQG